MEPAQNLLTSVKIFTYRSERGVNLVPDLLSFSDSDLWRLRRRAELAAQSQYSDE